MTIDDLTTRSGQWLSGGPLSEIVISSRVRLARNLAGFPFLSKATEAQRREIEHLLGEKIGSIDLGHETFYVDIARSSELDRQVLVERHLISRQHAEGEGHRGVILSTTEEFALMVNEEDHLRLQALRGGFQRRTRGRRSTASTRRSRRRSTTPFTIASATSRPAPRTSAPASASR